MPMWLGVSIALIYGVVVGSFLNVCIWRLPRDESLVSPGSHCPKCNTLLRAWDLIPLFSFLIQRCKCRYCKTPISWRYFTVESLTGVFFALTYLRFGWSLDTLVFALFGASLIATFLIDMEHYIIPDQLNLFGIGIGVARDVYGIVIGERDWHTNIFGASIPIPQSVVGILVCGGIFLLIAVISYYIFKKEGIGGGDIKLAAAIGATIALGPSLLSFFIAVTLGSVIGVALMASNKKSRKDYLPFGPFMVVGAMVAMFYGRQLIDLYLNYVGLGAAGG